MKTNYSVSRFDTDKEFIDRGGQLGCNIPDEPSGSKIDPVQATLAFHHSGTFMFALGEAPRISEAERATWVAVLKETLLDARGETHAVKQPCALCRPGRKGYMSKVREHTVQECAQRWIANDEPQWRDEMRVDVRAICEMLGIEIDYFRRLAT